MFQFAGQLVCADLAKAQRLDGKFLQQRRKTSPSDVRIPVVRNACHVAAQRSFMKKEKRIRFVFVENNHHQVEQRGLNDIGEILHHALKRRNVEALMKHYAIAKRVEVRDLLWQLTSELRFGLFDLLE